MDWLLGYLMHPVEPLGEWDQVYMFSISLQRLCELQRIQHHCHTPPHYVYTSTRATFITQARMQEGFGGGGGVSRTPLLNCIIHNSACVSHTLLIELLAPPPPPPPPPVKRTSLLLAPPPPPPPRSKRTPLTCYHTFPFVLYRS